MLLSSCVKRVEFNRSITESEDLLEQLVQNQKIPGLAVAVSIKNETVWTKSFGFADLEDSVRVKNDVTKFRIGSVSKPVTAMAIARLVESRQLDLDEPIQKYVPDFPKKKYPITTRMLAGHLAGIRHYRGNEFASNKYYPTVSEGLSIFQNDTLLYRPNTKYSYSSYGWNLISAVIEGASGEEFLPFMEKHVFAPLKMGNTIADYVDSIIPNRTDFYELSEGKNGVVNAPFVDNSYKWAGGGFLSTTADMLKFGNAHLYPKLIKESTVKELLTSQLTTKGDTTHYGIGWKTGKNKNGRKWFGHSGGSVGGITMLIVYPEYELVLILLSNSSNVSYQGVFHEIAEKFINEIGKKE